MVVTRNVALDRVTSTVARHEVAVDAGDVGMLLHHVPIEPQQSVDEVLPTVNLLLQSLSPLERAVFVLHDVLDWSYADVARLTARDEAAPRQLTHRARRYVAAGPERYEVSPREAGAAARRLVAACAGADVDPLLDALAPELVRVPTGARWAGDKLVHDVAGLALVRHGRLAPVPSPARRPLVPGRLAGARWSFRTRVGHIRVSVGVSRRQAAPRLAEATYDRRVSLVPRRFREGKT